MNYSGDEFVCSMLEAECSMFSEDCEFIKNKQLSCYNKIAGTLTKKEMIKHGLILCPESEKIIEDVTSYEPTTFDLKMGDGHYIYDGSFKNEKNKWKLIFIGEEERLKQLNENDKNHQYSRPNGSKAKTLTIPAYGSALIQLEEIVDTATVAEKENVLIVGRFDLKLSRVHQGLISQQATQIEPCYRGKLFCFIHNLSNKEIELKYGDKVATIEFSYVSCFCNATERENIIRDLIKRNKEIKYKKECCDGKGINDIRYFYYNDSLPTNCGLLSLEEDFLSKMTGEEIVDKVSEKVNKKVDKKAKWIPVLCAIISLIAIAISTAVPAYFNAKNTTLSQEVENLKQIVENIESQQ